MNISDVNNDGIAMDGMDPVASFYGRPLQGNEAFRSQIGDLTYYFASKANKATFTQSPSMYVPQFDGYCAWGVGEKQAKFPINPETFDVIDGKLYLFFNGDFNGEPFNTFPDWSARTSELKKAAHTHWPKVRDGK